MALGAGFAVLQQQVQDFDYSAALTTLKAVADATQIELD